MKVWVGYNNEIQKTYISDFKQDSGTFRNFVNLLGPVNDLISLKFFIVR